MADQAETEEFVVNPSKATKRLVDIVLRLQNRYDAQLKTKNPIKKIRVIFKIKIYFEAGYREFFYFLKDYKIPSQDLSGIKKLDLLFKEFEKIYDKLIFNNIVLAYARSVCGEISNKVLTKEDEKILFLKKLFLDEITTGQFNEKFGHYALNAYELSSKRFEEYDSSELASLAKLVADFKTEKIEAKIPLETYINSGAKDKSPILIALRELAKYHTLFLVRAIRYELLRLAQQKHIKNIFEKSYEEISMLDRPC